MEWSTMALFYFACLVFGFLGALLGAVTGGGGHFHIGGAHFHIGGGDHGIHLGHGLHLGGHAGAGIGHAGPVAGGAAHPSHEVAGSSDEGNMPGASIFNGITVFTFIGFFGISGLAAIWGLKLSPLASLAIALPAALAMAAAEFVLYVKLFVNAQASSEATLSEILGCEACVISGIPADRVGQITYVIKGSRFTAPAVAAEGEAIARGTKVLVVNVRGATFVVRPI